MIESLTTVRQPTFQLAWKEAMSALSRNQWEVYNLVVQIEDPCAFDEQFHQEVEQFCRLHGLLGPRHVAYTIFPRRLYRIKGSADKLFGAYNRQGGLYDWLRTRPLGGWGTYFRRMTHYESLGGAVNQLHLIIEAINRRRRVWKAAYTVVIQEPGEETTRPRGAPCLNYIAVQMEPKDLHPSLGLLCVYRNHDMLERAYGNYWGLCNLAHFLAQETHSTPGSVTCVSSHAYVGSPRRPVRDLLSRL
jgi:hypothetical protein